MILSEQEMINAICLHQAERRQLQPEDVDVELMWDENNGYSAEVYVQNRSQILVEANMLEAIERYLLKQYDIRVFRDQIRLDLEDEMFAVVNE